LIKPRVAKGKGGKGEGNATKGGGKGSKDAKKGGGKETKAALPEPPALADEEVEMQRQMAKLGLPVSFTASVAAGDKGEDEDEDEDDEEESEDE